MTTSKLLLAGAAGLALSFGAGGAAHAVPAYGFAELHFENFTLSGGTFVGTSVQATDNANYPGFPTAGTTTFGNITTGVDVPQATSGPGLFPVENTFTKALLPASALTPAGTRGDARITGPITGGAISDIVAEGKLSVPGSSAGSGSGSNTSLEVTFTTAGGTVNLTFSASSQGEVDVGSVGDNAAIVTAANFRIKNNAGGFVTITDNINPANSSTNIQPDALNLSASTLDPASPVIINNPLTAYSYSATLAAGTYTISLVDSAQVTLATAAVPEPMSMALLGTGLVGVGLLRRTRKTA